MGSAFRVDVHYCKLPEILATAKEIGLPVYGTFLDGDNIFTTKLSNKGVIVLGNEGHGILPETEKQITKRILIPCGAPADKAPESLNVATATSIVCSEFFRQCTFNA
jgi:TrmH family RNA methyltransferase